MLKLISINIETDMHHDTVVQFLKQENPDVVCFQEIFENDMHIYEETLGMRGNFKPMSIHPSIKNKGETREVVGLAIFTRFEATPGFEYYVGDKDTTPIFSKSTDLRILPHISNHLVLWVEMVIDEKLFRIGTTHLSVTYEGISTPYQIEQANKLLGILSRFENIIICGDFNAPRGLETFSLFSEKYIDNIPERYNSSLDPKLHKIGGTPDAIKMVDGLFSTSECEISDVKLVEGVSDHKAIVAWVK
jgi:exonuclease III